MQRPLCRKSRALLNWPELAGRRLIDRSIADTQHADPRGVREGRLLTPVSAGRERLL